MNHTDLTESLEKKDLKKGADTGMDADTVSRHAAIAGRYAAITGRAVVFAGRVLAIIGAAA